MGKCLSCGKKLGWLEGYSYPEGEYCDNCCPKGDEILKKKEGNEEKRESKSSTEKTKLTTKQKEKFKEIIEEGKWNYVLKRGLSWGFLTGLLFYLIYRFILNEEIIVDTFYVALWAVAGLIAGFWGWRNINKKVNEK